MSEYGSLIDTQVIDWYEDENLSKKYDFSSPVDRDIKLYGNYLENNNLDMLRIHEEESMIKNTEKRITEQFGYFNIELLILERVLYTCINLLRSSSK
mgnify:CR=1 FL=1